MLSMFVNDRRDNWHELLPYAMHAYRTSVHESTCYCPFRLMMGEECSLPQEVSTAELCTNREQDIAPHPFATWVRDALEVAYDHVRESLRRTAAHRKRLYDTKAVNRKFPIGSWGCCDTTHRRLNTNWVLHGLDLIRSFVRPPVTRWAFSVIHRNLSSLYTWTILNCARCQITSNGVLTSPLLNHCVLVQWLSDRVFISVMLRQHHPLMCPVGRTWPVIIRVRQSLENRTD